MITPPPPPAAQREAIMEYYAQIAPTSAPRAECNAAYRLTWPSTQGGVCCIAGQWRRNEAGDIEAWYSATQLREVLAAMQAAQRRE